MRPVLIGFVAGSSPAAPAIFLWVFSQGCLASRQVPDKIGGMKKGDFPRVIRVGQTKATIYKTPSHDCCSFTVVWYEGAVRKRKSFADLGLAEVHANAQVNNLSTGEARAAKLSGEECLEYVRAREAVKEFGVSLDSVAMEY